MSSVEWVVFDVMGVVFPVGDDTNDLLVPFIWERNAAISREEINRVYLAASRGEIRSAQFWKAVGLGAGYPEIEKAYLDGCLAIDPEFVPVARRLRESFRVGLLSNDLSEWSAYLRTKFGLDFLDAVTISGDVRCRKPSPEIYRCFCETAGASPERCVFVDDRCKNLAAAAALGFRTIRFARGPEESDFVPDATVASFGEIEAALAAIEGSTRTD